MFWFVLLATCTCAILGQKVEPKIIVDAKDYSGFPENFQYLTVDTNSGTDFKYRWHHNGILIDDRHQLSFIGASTRTLRVKDQGQSKEYAGTYQFFMDTPVGTIAGRKVKVDFTYVGEFLNLKDQIVVRSVVVGQAAFVTCPKHKSGNNFIYKWGKSSGAGGTQFVVSANNYIVLDNGTLFFSYLKKRDLTYINELKAKCGMEANVGKDNRFTWSDVVKMKNVSTNFTKFGPEIVTSLPVKKFSVGETIYLKCAAAGNPVPLYSWTVIDSEGNKKSLVDGQDDIDFADGDPRILEIKPTKKSHAGKYICTATIGQKNDSVQGELIYEEEPSWISAKIKSVTPSIYSNHTWLCEATGSPKPKYIWYVNGTKLDDGPNHKINGGRISFTKLPKKYSGMYECVANNRLNNIYQTAYLDVQAEKPSFDIDTADKTLFLNNQGTIKCSAEAAPAAKNKWMKDGVIIDTTLAQYKVVNNEDLVIAKVSKSDIGEYTCTARNLYGKAAKKFIVKVVGEITFITAPVDTNVTQGGKLTLNCEAKGEADLTTPIKYKWRFNNKALKGGASSNVYWSLDSKKLVFLEAEVKQSGVYECIAYIDSPSYAEKIRSARIIIRGPPDEMNTVQVVGGCGSLEAKLTWSILPSFDPISYFIVEWRTSYELNKWQRLESNVSGDSTEVIVPNLSPYAQYSFRVMAVNQIGTSKNSYHTDFNYCITPDRVPSKCPQPKGVAGGDGELTIKWEKMKLLDLNGKNFKYLVEYKESLGSWQNISLIAVTESFDVPNAGYYQWWNFRIRGVNDEGPGPACSGKAFSGQNAPNVAPANLRAIPSTDYVLLHWDPIVLNPGSVDSYKVKYWQRGDSSSKRRRSLNSNVCNKNSPCTKDSNGKTTLKVDGLAAVQTYVVQVWGYNSGGAGPNSSLNVTTNEGLPDLPTDVDYILYAKYIELRWKKPKIPNGIIIGYTVIIEKPEKITDEVGADVKRYVFRELKPEQSYKVSVYARTKEGGGTKVELMLKTKKVSVPAQPDRPLVVGTGEDSVNVTFREGKPSRGFAETFSVLYRKKGEGDAELKESDPQSLFGKDRQRIIVIPGLDVTSKYEFATIASNYHGKSKASAYNDTIPGAGNKPPQARSHPIYKRSWFVALIVIVCVLLLFLIIALLVTRKRGERYPVGKREKKRAGILDHPEDAEPDDYSMKPRRTNGNNMNRNGSKSSLPNRDPDRDSLDEYGEDRGFGEDAASLIGEYNDDTKKPSAVEGPQFV